MVWLSGLLPFEQSVAVAVEDGALWIWDAAETVCRDGQQIVDWYHAVEHLNEAAFVIYLNEKALYKRQRWLKIYKHPLYMGNIDTIISVLHKCDVSQFAIYFERHQRWMQYLEFWEEGLSATVERGVKQFKQRLCSTDMRWPRYRAKRMIILLSVILGHEFDELWTKIG